MSRNLSVFGVNERIEAVVIALWVVTDLIFTSAVIRASASALHGAIGKGTLKIFILAASVGALAGAIFCARDAFVLSKVSEYWVPLGNIFFTCVLFPVVFIIGIWRNRKGKRKQDTISGG